MNISNFPRISITKPHPKQHLRDHANNLTNFIDSEENFFSCNHNEMFFIIISCTSKKKNITPHFLSSIGSSSNDICSDGHKPLVR